MIYVALGSLGFACLTVVLFVGLLRSLVRQHGRERDLMLNQLLNLAGRPWQAAPATLEPLPDFGDVDDDLDLVDDDEAAQFAER